MEDTGIKERNRMTGLLLIILKDREGIPIFQVQIVFIEED